MPDFYGDSDSTVPRLLASGAEAAPSATAIVAPGRDPLGYGDLTELIGAGAARLGEFGLGPGARIALVTPNGPEAATAFLALACTAACAPLNPAYRREELDFYLDDLGADAVVAAAGLDSPVREAARDRGLPLLELGTVAGSPAGTFTLDGTLAPSAGIPARKPDEHALLLHTSGTTSRPKLVPLTQRNLAVSAANVAGTLVLGPDDRCLNLMPLFHVHGLVAALLASLRAGGSIACTPGFHALRAFEWLRDLDPTWYTAVPTMHQALVARAADHAAELQAHRLRFVRSSSAALPAPVHEQLERVFGVPVIEAYGMTEAAHQMASNPLPPGRRRPGSVGPAAGPEIAVLSPNGAELPPGSVGEVAIRGPSVFAGYEGSPEANATAFVDGWYRTGDEGFLDGDRYLTLSGRIKELINRGGEKIAPVEVDERLLSHPAVAEAVTFAVPDARLGEEVAAAVVLARGGAADERDLQDFAAQTLAPFKVPRQIVIVDEIPKGPTGKVQRIGLASHLGLEGAGTPAAAGGEPRTTGERLIASIWSQVLAVPSIGLHDDFFSLGGDSILGAEAVARTRELTGLADLPLVSIVRAPTVAAMAAELDHGISALGRSGAVRLSSTDAGLPFFFVHGGDGDLLAFVALARALGDSCSFYGLRARGIDDGGPVCTSIEEMAAEYAASVRAVQPEGPYRIGGFCVGGLVAIEMAHVLEAGGDSASLVLVDPRLPRPNDPRALRWLVGQKIRQRRLTRAAWGRVRRRGRPPAAVSLSPIEREIDRLREAHRPRPYRGPVVALLAENHERHGVPVWHLQRILPNARLVQLPRRHDRILQARSVEPVARELSAALALLETEA